MKEGTDNQGGGNISRGEYDWPLEVEADPIGRVVVITKETWFRHIVERHPVMKPFLEQVIATLRAPQVVARHRRHADRLCLFRNWETLARFPAKWLEAMALFSGSSGRGMLLSAWPTNNLRGGEIVWLGQMRL